MRTARYYVIREIVRTAFTTLCCAAYLVVLILGARAVAEIFGTAGPR